MHGGNGKHFFKKALEPRLPDDVLYRPKMGFAVPLARWFRGPLRERVRAALLQGPMLDGGWFNADVIRRHVEEHESGARDHSGPIWSLLMFDAFLRRQGAGLAPAADPQRAAA